MKHGIKKAIKVKIYGTECYDVSISMELGKLILDKRLPELVDVKKIYVIYEVFYAQSVSVSVTIGKLNTIDWYAPSRVVSRAGH